LSTTTAYVKCSMQEPLAALTILIGDLLERRRNSAGRCSRFVYGWPWIGTSSAISRSDTRSISGITETAFFVCCQPATQLVYLYPWKTAHSGYYLSALTSLERLSLEFESPRSRPNQRRRPLPPPTRFVLPSLTCLHPASESPLAHPLLRLPPTRLSPTSELEPG